jgi:hypothetical protein
VNYRLLLEQLFQSPNMLEEELRAVCVVDQNAIRTDIVRQSSLYMKWAYLSSLAENKTAMLKRKIEEEILPAARAEAEHRLVERGRKVFKQTIEDIAYESTIYRVAREDLENWKLVTSILRKVEFALVQKKDMLQSLNSRQKVELSALPEDHALFSGIKETQEIQEIQELLENQQPQDRIYTETEIEEMAQRVAQKIRRKHGC